MTASTLSPEAQAQLAKLATDLANDPKTRKGFVKLVKEIDPTKRFPDVETDEIREDMKKEFEKRDAERAKQDMLAKQEAQKNKLKDRYDDKSVGEIEALMEKLGISDYAVGARLYASENAENVRPGDFVENDHKWSLPSFDPAKDLNNLAQVARSKAYQEIDKIKRERKAS